MGSKNVVECYTQAVKAREMQLEALANEDHAMAILYKEIATTLAGYTSEGHFTCYVNAAVSYYKKAIEKKRRKEQKEA